MISVREATIEDVQGISDVFRSAYGRYYMHPQFYDAGSLTRMVFAEGTVLLVAVDSEAENRVAGTASVVFSVGAYNDLIGEFGRLVVHPDYRSRGIGKQLMKARLELVQSRLHVGIVENRAVHSMSQQISRRHGFVPIGFLPMKLRLEHRESVATYVRYFGDALELRRNNPRIIPEAGQLAAFALGNCGLPQDAIIDETSAPYPHNEEFELEAMTTEGYTPLLRIERGRVRNREVFGPIRLHYGLFQLQARHSHYLIARRAGQVAGGVGYTLDEADRAVRIFELITANDEPIRFLLNALLCKCKSELDAEYVDVDISAYSPRMQRTMLELGFLPVSYLPANVFHEVERLDTVKMANILVPFELGEIHLCEEVRPIADAVIGSFSSRKIAPHLADAMQSTLLFEGLSDEQRLRLAGICTPRSFRSGDSILQSGDMDATMYVILSGDVEFLDKSQRHVATISTGQCAGETVLLHAPDNAPSHTLNAHAKSEVSTAAIANRDFHELVRRRPDIGVVVYRNLAVDISAKLRQRKTSS